MANVDTQASSDGLHEKLIGINRVAKVVKGGRRFGFAALVVVGAGEDHLPEPELRVDLLGQAAEILQRVERFDNKLYLEFGGKLLFDYHASRVLPGFDPNVKMRLLHQLRDKAEIILCIWAGDIERRKVRADFSGSL